MTNPDLCGNQLLLSIPQLELEHVPVRDSPKQSYLDREGIVHLSRTGLLYEPGSNTYIAGHAADFATRAVFPTSSAARINIDRGDLTTLRDAAGRTHNSTAPTST